MTYTTNIFGFYPSLSDPEELYSYYSSYDSKKTPYLDSVENYIDEDYPDLDKDIANHRKKRRTISLPEDLQNYFSSFENDIIPDDLEHAKIISDNIDWFFETRDGTVEKYFFKAIEKNHFETVKVFIDNIPTLKFKTDGFKRTPLMIAVINGNKIIVEYLLQDSFLQNSFIQTLKEKDVSSCTAIFHAAQRGFFEILETIIDYIKKILKIGASYFLNISDFLKESPLMIAARNNHLKVVKLLVRNGADTKLVNESDETALSIAAQKRHELIKNYLITDSFKKSCQLENFSKSQKKDKKNALVFFPTYDTYEKSFTFEDKKKYVDQLKKIYNVKVIYPSTIDEINKCLKKRKYHFISFSGHGTEISLTLTKKFVLNKFNIDDIDFDKQFKKTIIVLDSCNTGKENGLANCLSILSNRKVYAANDFCTKTKIKYRKGKTKVNLFLEKKDVTVVHKRDW